MESPFAFASLEDIYLHYVGNKHEGLAPVISKDALGHNQALRDTLGHYFLKPFQIETLTAYKFIDSLNLSYNKTFSIARDFFSGSKSLQEASEDFVHHLYEQSTHPHIKPGQVFITKIRDVVLSGKNASAIGIFKAERRQDFLKFYKQENSIDVELERGVDVGKLDKGCIILNREEEDGLRLFMVDSNPYDTQYWKDHFLGVDYVMDNNYQTSQFVKLCKDFSNEVLHNNNGIDKRDQISFLAETVKFMGESEQLDLQAFTGRVFNDSNLQNEFVRYKSNFEGEQEFSWSDDFEVSQAVLKKERKKIKNLIQLDTNIQIKLDFNNPESGYRFIERGYDQEKGMSYYKVFFNEERN